jgi:hypothetical protein
MAIVHFENQFNRVPEGAANIRFEGPGFNLDRKPEDVTKSMAFGPYVTITWDTHQGLCIEEFERNRYHDSDFYMVIWNPETKKPENYCFASTRGWSYPSYNSRADATPEVMAEYKAYVAASERKARICAAWKRRGEQVRIARAIGESNYRKLSKLRAGIPAECYNAAIKLITSTRTRNSFKLSLRQQILDWYFNPEPRYSQPLTRKQWQYV